MCDVAMLRRLLTLFALLSGLAATPAGAEARANISDTQVQAASEIVVIAEARIVRAPIAERSEPASQTRPIATTTAVLAPAVRLKVDRARE